MISAFCRTNLEIQGILGSSDEELAGHRMGFRFAYQLCFTITALGVVFQSKPILAVACSAAFLGVFPPYHPFDYLYKFGVRHVLRKPKLPPRTNQGRFACGIAAVWLGAAIFFFARGWAVAGLLMGAGLLVPAGLVAFFDVCLPSMIFNLIFHRRLNPRPADRDGPVRPGEPTG